MEWWQAVPESRLIGRLGAVAGLTHDSRAVKPGGGFIAVPGQQADGHDYIEAALKAGAAVAVVQADHEEKWAPVASRLPLVVVPDTRAAMGPLASALYDFPSRKLRIVGVTGTDGKTTSSHLIGHVLDRCGFEAGFLTSAGLEVGHGLEQNASHMTTLEATLLQSQLARAAESGRKTMVVEASSEGLVQHRLAGVEVDVAVFTNLTRDHLDFHGTMENYLAAKGLLFEMLDGVTAKTYPRAAVLNAGDRSSEYLATRSKAPVLRYGLNDGVDVRGSDIEVMERGLRFRVTAYGGSADAFTPMFGSFNVYNCLAAVGVALSQGAPLSDAVAALSDFPGVPGRLEAVDCGQPFRVYIDIASTPAALENTLNALRPTTTGRLWAVFGAAGGRDPARRDGMGRVAGKLASRAVLTNEDPRDEDPDAIIEAIASGLREAGCVEGRDFVRRPDRREAIAYAFENAAAGDTVLLAGKANETSMIFEGGRQVSWNERAVAEELLRGERA